MERWEYKYVTPQPSEAELNALGAQGWELVGVITEVIGSIKAELYGGGSSGSIGSAVTLIFKRRLP